MDAPALRGFYAILDVKEAALAEPILVAARAEELLAARPCFLQLRAKRLPAAQVRDVARAVLPLCRRAGIPFCLNDRLDLALVVGADAVHVGQDDLPLGDVRAVRDALGRKLWIGVSTHNLAQARAAAEGGADYIGLGPVFATTTKERPDPVVGLEGLREVVAAVPVPVVAIGGITRARVPAVAAAGAAAAAVIADIEQASDRSAAAREVVAAFGGAAHV